jgi:hypothetical protein
MKRGYGGNVVVLAPDIAKAFRSFAAVNEALRSLLRMSDAAGRQTKRASARRYFGLPGICLVTWIRLSLMRQDLRDSTISW